jgi:branched-subunit amino acid transport protein
MSATLTFWLVVAAVGAVNFLSRLSFIALFARREMPALLRRALRYVPAAMLTAIVVPAVVLAEPGTTGAALPAERLAAALVAGVVAWRTRSVTATILVGMAVLWVLAWVLRTAA